MGNNSQYEKRIVWYCSSVTIHSAAVLLESVRVSRGLTQATLAERSGIAQGMLSKLESGKLDFDAERIGRLSEVLDVPPALFSGVRVADHAKVFHRKQASLPAKVGNKLLADLQLAHLHVSHLADGVLPALDVPHLPLPDDGYYTPADRAREIRKIWGLGTGPIPDMVELLESHGVVCVTWPVESARVDAIASWPTGEVPVLLMRGDAPMDRVRFTLAHELGHGVLHDFAAAEREAEADQFAAEFLFPAAEARPRLKRPSMMSLTALKAEWGMSIAALVRRARDVGAIGDSEYRSLNIELSAAGMRKAEPVTLPAERPRIVRSAVAARQKSGETLAGIAEQSYLTEVDLLNKYLETS